MGRNPVTVILMATKLEAKPFIRGLDLRPADPHPFPVFASDRQVLVISGIGKAAAAMATAYACQSFAPGVIVNAGAAGALGPGHPAGEFYRIDKIIEHDRPHILTGAPMTHRPARMKKIGAVPTAVLATGDRPVIDPDQRQNLARLADLVDMEAAAVIQAARTWQVPGHVFKFVSDDPGHTAGIQIVANIRVFREPFFRFIQTAVLPQLG